MAVEPADLFWLDGTQTRNPDQLSDGGMIEPVALVASLTPDYAPPGAHTAGIWAISATTPTSISGIEAPLKGGGRRLLLMNVGSIAITILQNNAGSQVPNRILCADVTHLIEPGQLVALYYFPTLAKWVLGVPSATAPPAPGPVDHVITRAIASSFAVLTGTTHLQRDPEIADAVEITIQDGGELLIL